MVEIGETVETGERKMSPSGVVLGVASLLKDLLWVCSSSSLLDKTMARQMRFIARRECLQGLMSSDLTG